MPSNFSRPASAYRPSSNLNRRKYDDDTNCGWRVCRMRPSMFVGASAVPLLSLLSGRATAPTPVLSGAAFSGPDCRPRASRRCVRRRY